MYTKIKPLEILINEYLLFCSARKNLDHKTIKSYSIDLKQYCKFSNSVNYSWFNKKAIERYIEHIHTIYMPKSIKRKIASLKAFFHYLEIEEILGTNPFHKIQLKYKEPFILPKTIPVNTIEQIMKFAYTEYKNKTTQHSKKTALRNVLVLELLFATGMRISELCSLTLEQIDINNYIIRIYGKGSKERLIQICNESIQSLIDEYLRIFNLEIINNEYIFTNRLNNKLSEQSVRNMINK